ncbi:hypothetical protein CCACVL1_14895 [Corchorus capsularis]|uniref:Uncharacterized protein n=1 Tax=Corchorus capsularis TaxID=210143 RepID=A0A1R3I550_COCAP|nr:hypothetical protein CCACVL1_14895 [Corchorus capsularis]
MSQEHSRRDQVGHDQHFSLQEPITIGKAARVNQHDGVT